MAEFHSPASVKANTLSWFIGILELNVALLQLLATLVLPHPLLSHNGMTVAVYLKM